MRQELPTVHNKVLGPTLAAVPVKLHENAWNFLQCIFLDIYNTYEKVGNFWVYCYLCMNILFLRVKNWLVYQVLGHPELIQICINAFRFIMFQNHDL